MLLGLIGKPSCGKSTFFKAASLADVEIEAYPFTTIKPNRGVGYVRVKAVCKGFDVECQPRTGYCVNGTRFVPVELMDVAGLVEGASKGKGLGNQFLDDLRQADLFIHIVDVSGKTDAEGKEGEGNPAEDVRMIENELDLWYTGILKKVWKVFARTAQTTKSDFAKEVAKQFSGLNVNKDDVKEVLLKTKLNPEKPAEWAEDDLEKFANTLRHLTKPMIIAANKIDKEGSWENLKKLKKEFPDLVIVPCSADMELALREASKEDLIEYVPGDSKFKINEGKVNEKQKSALESIQKNVLDVYSSTGVQQVLDKAVFEMLKYIAVFPVATNKLTDLKGRVLPDCFLVPENTTALDFAYHVHTDFGKNFIKAVDAKTKQAVGKEHRLKHGQVVEIVT